MKLLFVINPISGGVDKTPFLEEAKRLCKKFGIKFLFFKTTGTKDQERLTEELKRFNPDRVVSVGGDGTTLFTAITLMHTKYPMGIIPLGSANGMAKELFVNPEPVEALKDLVMSSVIRGLDIVEINKKYHTIHLGDVGFNAKIVSSYSKDERRGMGTYAKYLLEEFQNLDPFSVKIEVRGNTYQQEGLMVVICNSRKYGTGVPINTIGNPMDGKFEIVIVKKIDVLSVIKAGLSRFDEKFIDEDINAVVEATSARITFDEPRLLQLDGEVIGEFEQLDVKMLAGAVKLITHNENMYIQ